MTDVKVIRSESLGEQYTSARLDNGLQILVLEKPLFRSAYAMFGTRYGSVDNVFRTENEPDFCEVPHGIAHFLEHKLFESEDGDAFVRFSKTGANANAYTSFDRTCYLFSCSENFSESFDILLDFVQHPYFTEATVQKEQGIIGQEISMYDDAADWVLVENLFGCLFEKNPVRINVAGTKETISHITADLLYRCYHTFYHPSNMFITVAGNVSAEQIIARAEQSVRPAQPVGILSKPYTEPEAPVKTHCERKMAVALPLFALGYKEPAVSAYQPVRKRVISELIMELLAGPQSPLYNSLLEDGLINTQFSAGYYEGRGFSVPVFTGESSRYNEVLDRIAAAVKDAKNTGFDAESFETVRRRILGSYIMSFNNVEHMADLLTGCACTGEGLYDEYDVYRTVTVQDINDHISSLFRDGYAAVSLILPDSEKKEAMPS